MMKYAFVIYCLLFSLSVFSQTPTPSPTPDAEKMKSDPEYKKKWEDYEKQLTETQEKNKQIAENNARIKILFDEANSAYTRKDYETAVKKYDEILAIDDFWGVSLVVLHNKTISLRQIGVEKYNNAHKAEQFPSVLASPYFLSAIESCEKAVVLLNANELEIKSNNKENFELQKYNLLKELAECYRLFSLTNVSKISEAIKAFEDYIALEQDETLKAKARKELAKLKSTTYFR